MKRLHYLDAEKSVLAAVLIGGDDVLDRVELDADEFFDTRHRAIFSAMRQLRAANKTASDPQLIEGELGSKSDAIGGLAYLSELVIQGSVPDRVEEYGALVRRSAITRAAVKALSDLQACDLEGGELLNRILETSNGLSRVMEDSAVSMPIAVRDALLEIDSAMNQEGATWGLPTGFDVLDAILGGIQIGVVTIVAGRPSMGKSALARSLADNVNRLGDCGVHVFTPEDSRKTYALRTLSDHSRVSLEKIRALEIKQGEFGTLQRAARELWERKNWLIDDTAGVSSDDIALRVRKHKRANNTKLVVVDYVQLLREKRVPLSDPQRHVAIASQNLVQLARSEEVAVLLLSQLSRECEKREDKRPLLSDLRQAGELEQDAEAVLMVYRDDYYDDESERPGVTEVLVRKNKNGRTGPAELAWDAETATHRPLTRRDDDYEERRWQ